MPTKPISIATDWQTYASQVSLAMELFLDGKITLDACYNLLPEQPDFIAQEIHEFIENSISEINNDEKDFRQLLSILKEGSQQDVIELMNSPP